MTIINNPFELAKRRVKRGVAWLNKNAPLGWQRNMFDILKDGTTMFRATNNYDNECVLALAFEYLPGMANEGGYVTFATVVNHFGLSNLTIGLGFDTGSQKRDPVTPEMLDQTWKVALLEYAQPSFGAYRHPIVRKEKAPLGQLLIDMGTRRVLERQGRLGS